MKRYLLYLLFLFVLFSACRKDHTSDPAPVAKGSITGVISPVTGTEAAIVAVATINGQAFSYNAVIDNNGNFKIGDLPAGNYTLTFTSGAGYTAPAGTTVTVIAGQNTDAGAIVFDAKPGSISGSITPAGAGSEVWAQDAGSVHTYITKAIDPVTGNFKISDIPAGTYTVYYLAAGRYTAPAGKTVVVTAGQNSDAGSVTYIPYGFASNYSFKVNGTPLSFRMARASYVSPNFSLTGGASEGVQDRIGYSTYRLVISLDNVTGPGTYICNSATISALTYSWYAFGYPESFGTWTSQKTGGSAMVIVTAIDPAAGTISGTFTATLIAGSGNVSTNQVITDGTFTAAYN